MEDTSIEYALLSMQRALLGEVTPALRAVLINLDQEQDIFYANFYYEGEVSEKRVDLWDCAIAETSAALGSFYFIKSWIKRLDYPEAIPVRGYCAYLKKEGQGTLLQKVIMQEPTIGYALVAVQQSLLGRVTPELRSVIVDLEKSPLRLYIRFYHDGEISKDLYQCWSVAMEAAQLYFGFSCALDGAIHRVDCPQPMPFRGRYAYLRSEEVHIE